jgi:hypothetical protein
VLYVSPRFHDWILDVLLIPPHYLALSDGSRDNDGRYFLSISVVFSRGCVDLLHLYIEKQVFMSGKKDPDVDAGNEKVKILSVERVLQKEIKHIGNLISFSFQPCTEIKWKRILSSSSTPSLSQLSPLVTNLEALFLSSTVAALGTVQKHVYIAQPFATDCWEKKSIIDIHRVCIVFIHRV